MSTNEFPTPDPHARLGEYLIPANARPTQCKSCQASIVWTKTGTGANMPLSLATIREDAQGRHWALNHWADCPDAAQHRRPSAPARNAAKPSGTPVDLRDLHDYLERNHLVVIGSTMSDDGNGKLLITLQTERKE
jgi:hypothetical protein